MLTERERSMLGLFGTRREYVPDKAGQALRVGSTAAAPDKAGQALHGRRRSRKDPAYCTRSIECLNSSFVAGKFDVAVS